MRYNSGTPTFLFTDIEGSTRRWESHPDEMRAALARHDALVRAAVCGAQGRVFKAVGDAFCAVFPSPAAAVRGALAVQRALAAESWGAPGPLRVRAAIHCGAAEERDDDYFGPALNRVARLLCAGHGGQTLLSRPAADAAADALPTGATLRDLGERRLKDLARPERVFQLVAADLPADFPPLRTLDARPNNLPAQVTAMIGRQKELARVRARLREPGVRLLTLTGPGGTGKTRLALQSVAELADEFAHGVWFVALAPIREAGLVLPAIAAALGVNEAPGRCLADGLKEFLRERRTLLLLDNFEQVLDAAPEVAALLEAAAGLKLLVTSRALLRVYGENDFQVPPLGLPARGATRVRQCRDCEAALLFAERARAVRPDFEITERNAQAVAELCAQLDGLPLAIELAAAQIRLFSPEAMLTQLRRCCGSLDLLSGGARNLPERQRTLRSTIAWSHELLDEQERAVFRRLSVFCGGWDQESAAAVLGQDRVLAALGSLLDKSLVRVVEADGAPRFTQLETIREFACERLDADGETEEFRRRHQAFFLALAETCEERLAGPDQQAWFGRLSRELDNFRAALARALAQRDADAALRLAAGLGPLWLKRGQYTEGRARIESALALAGGAPPAARARAICALGAMLNGLGELAAALARLEEALRQFRAIGDRKGAVCALTDMAWVLTYQGEMERAEAVTAQLLAESRALGDPRHHALALERAASVALERGDRQRSMALLEEALVLMRRAQDKLGLAILLNVLGEDVRSGGDFARAAGLYEESLGLSSELENPFWMSVASVNLAYCLIPMGDCARARSLATQSLATIHAIGNKRNIPPGLVLICALAAAAGKAERGAVLLGAAEKFLAEQGTVLVYADRGIYEQTVRDVRAAVGAAAYAAARAEGGALSLEAAVARALGLAAELDFGPKM
jgi:predicted ATPase/class 3 adenylate cyclase